MVTKALYNILSQLFVGSHRIMSLLWLMPLCMLFSLPIMAQDEEDDPDMVTAEFVIQMKNDKGADIPGIVKYAKFKSYKQALDAQNRLKVAITQNENGALDDPIGTTIRQLKIKFKESVTGSFTQRCFYGDGVLVFAGEKFVKAFEIKKGTKKYSEVFKEKTQVLREIDVKGEYRINSGDSIDDDVWDTEEFSIFDLKVSFQPGRVKDNSRLTIHTAVVNCNTDDTVAYLKPIVIEGLDYHTKQERRMAFNYHTNDSMAVGYDSTKVLRSNLPFTAKVTARYKKPEGQSKTLFNAVKYVVLDDYHNPYYVTSEGAGSCLAKSPFKFLDFSVASKDIPLTSEFQEEAEENYQSVPRDLKLKFVRGTDELTKDSLNQVELGKLIAELRSYGKLLRVVNVRGGASPEGRLERNIELAKKRSLKAVNLIKGHLPSTAHINQRDPIVFTWDDVVAAVNKRKDVEQNVKDMVANLVANSKPDEVIGQLVKLPFYETVIVPELENLRIMQVEYKYEREYIMDADEAVEAYYRDKEKLKSGERTFSPGDFYNLYSAITDSAELDTITTIAYKTITAKPRYQYIPLAPYVCNKMAMIKMQQGVPDLDILRPFINLKRNMSYTERDFNTQKVLMVYNRPEIMINQAIAYFQTQKLDSAVIFVNRINNPSLTSELSHFINFRKYYLQGVRGEIKDPETKKKMEAARDYVLSSDYNKAIIFTEMKTALKNNFEYVDALLDKMDDENAKKWYLKGILWEEKAGKEPSVSFDDGFKELSDTELDMLYLQSPDSVEAYNRAKEAHDAKYKDLKDNDAPHFLAYFQHSFDLEPELKRQYFREGNVNETRRERNPYKKKDIQKYRDKFKVLLFARDANKVAETTDDELPTSEEDNRED